MISRLTLDINLLHDERMVSLIVNRGPESVAVYISVMAILRQRGSIALDTRLLDKIRHDLSFTISAERINADLEAMVGCGILASDNGALSFPEQAAPTGSRAPRALKSNAAEAAQCEEPQSPEMTNSPQATQNPPNSPSPRRSQSAMSHPSPQSPQSPQSSPYPPSDRIPQNARSSPPEPDCSKLSGQLNLRESFGS